MPAPYAWPTDAKGKAPSHTITWEQHQQNLTTKPGASTGAKAALPVDPVYDAEVSGLSTTRDTALGAATGERARGLSEYGFTEGAIDPVTGHGALALDPNNPFGKAALLKYTYDQGRARAGQSMASTGQLNSGAYQTQQDIVNRGQLQDDDALQKSLIGFLTGNTANRTQASTDFEVGSGTAEGARLARAPQNPNYSPTSTAAAPAAPAPKAPPIAPPKPKKPKPRVVTYHNTVKGP